MHIGLVAGALLVVCGSPYRRRGLLGLLTGMWIYAALGGLGPTVLRSCAMATWGALGLHLGRLRQPLRGLGLASLLLVLQAPERRHDLGLQLSCLSTAGLLVWAPPLARLALRLAARGWIGRLAAWTLCSGGIGLAAQAATLPLTLHHFGVLAWISPLANLVFVPLTDAALVLALLGAPLVLASETLGRPLLLLAGGLLALGDWIGAAVTSGLETRVFLPASPAAVAAAALLGAAVLGLGLAVAARHRGRTRACGLTALAATAALAWCAVRPERPTWQLEALDVGQGDALVLQVGAETWVVDAGDARPADQGARVLVPHLRRAGVHRLRGLVLTHPHRDHIGGALSVARAVPIDTLYAAAASRADPAYAALRAAVPAVPWRMLRRGARLALGPAYEAVVLWPESTDVLGSGANGCSLVLWATGSRGPDLLLQGDLEADGEARLGTAWGAQLAAAAPRFAILKAGHHGSDTSSTPAFLGLVQPEVAVLSVGAHNRYGHPGRRALATFAAQGCSVLRTDRGGAVRLRRRGTALWLERPGARAQLVADGLGPG
jgi:competence protein ComEC